MVLVNKTAGLSTPRDGRETSSRRSSFSLPVTPRGEGDILEFSNLKIFSFNDLRTATRNFRPDSVLGEGGFGCVFKGWVDETTFKAAKPGTGMVIAVKRLNQDGLQGHKEWLVSVYYYVYISRTFNINLIQWARPFLASKRRVLRVIDARIQGQYTPTAALKAATLAVRCLATEPKQRPKMKEVVAALEALQDTAVEGTGGPVQHRRTAYRGGGAASYPRPSTPPPLVASL
ncbi:hypothetical protein SASPL_147714 [Salvia splendens]|uniref:Uncharacterized protein n=1 Tax=Salvia splendens TaxID=180675 RepID=A0A8X8WEG4_SALSN|nr:hypothetical protein SASPL_147714 [Salvia splendens]